MIRDHMQLEEVTQNLIIFKKEGKIYKIIGKLHNMDDIEVCSCEGLIPQKIGIFGQNEDHSLLDMYRITSAKNQMKIQSEIPRIKISQKLF